MKVNYSVMMKVALCAMFSAGNGFAATIIVDNNPNHSADYTTLQEAVDAATAGDTILIGPSFNGNSYGDADIKKKLFIYGTGYLLEENNYKGGVSQLGYITFWGDFIGLSPNGSIISGVEANSIDISVQDDEAYVIENISIKRNKIGQVSLNSSNQELRIKDIIISNNMITGGAISIGNAIAIINNNIIKTNSTSGTGFVCFSGEILMFNNSFIYAKASFNPSQMFNGECSGEVYGNIFNEYEKGSSIPVNIHDNYNGTYTVLEQQVYTWTGSEDSQFQLRANSLAKGACLNGADCGAFAGTTPYILSGLPPRPRITNLELPASVLKTDTTMQVTVSAESRN
ncbi:hypothetical protein GCAAIG_02830 [Candidatus Electronema halotolerans]